MTTKVFQTKAYQAVIPARGGSKRFPNKNITNFLGLPLIAHSIKYAKECGIFEEVFVNTDSDSIAKVATDFGAKVVFRPEELGGDFTPTVDVLKFQLDWFKEQGVACEALVLMQATSPIRPQGLVKDALSKFEDAKRLSLATYSSLHKKYGTIAENHFFPENYKPGERMQDLLPRYYENGLLYITRAEAIRDGFIMTDDVYPMIIDHYSALIDIDEPFDLKFAEALFNSNN